MSIQAITWAFKQQVASPHLKFILICFANYATEYGTTYCSNRTIQSMTGMDEKTITKWVKVLEDTGMLVDTGKRQGKTESIKVYEIVAFEAHPKTEVLKSGVASPKTVELSTPKIGESPAPLIKINLKSKPKKNNSKISLLKWEENAGSQLCAEQMVSWIRENKYDPAKIKSLIVEFREKCLAAGKEYADFTMAFKVWLREGWLTVKPHQLKHSGTSDPKFQIYDRGNQL